MPRQRTSDMAAVRHVAVMLPARRANGMPPPARRALAQMSKTRPFCAGAAIILQRAARGGAAGAVG